MRVARASLGLLLAGVLLILPAARRAAAADAPALGPAENAALKHLLKDQGFSSALDDGVTFHRTGQIRIGRQDYDIYQYDHLNLHLAPGLVSHGLHKLVVVKQPSTYVGSYLFDDEPVSVQGARIVLGGPQPMVIEFGPGGPPRQAYGMTLAK